MNETQNVSEEFTATVIKADLPDLKIRVMPNVILGIPIVREKSEGGVILPESAQNENIPKVRIVAVGDGVELVKRGDVIHYAPYSNEVPFLSINGVKVIKIFIDEIIGVE
jgi:co-chaperonin GroES (HSP10)